MSSSLTATNGHAPQRDAWHTLSVREFFSTIAWTGEPVREPWTQPADGEVISVDGLDMQLSVGEFFNRFPWDGKPSIAAPMAPLEAQPNLPLPEDDLTLDGFADLF